MSARTDFMVLVGHEQNVEMLLFTVLVIIQRWRCYAENCIWDQIILFVIWTFPKLLIEVSGN